jgi:hypothetical protein
LKHLQILAPFLLILITANLACANDLTLVEISLHFGHYRFLQAQDQRDDEIVANRAGGRVIVHVAKDAIIFAAIDQPVETGSVPPRVMDIDATHIGVLLGASEWRSPADLKPIRLDRDLPHFGRRDTRYEASAGEGESDLETIGTAFLEKLRPLVSRLHHKLDFPADEPIFQLVVIGYAPGDYGPEVWVLEYRMEQEEVATRGEYWQTRLLRPKFTQLYPPEKHAPRVAVESSYPVPGKRRTVAELIETHDPRITRLAEGEPRFAKVVEFLQRGQANKTDPVASADFMRAVLPLLAGEASYVLGTMDERHGLDWVVPPDEPVEKAKDDKNAPPEAPSLRRRPKP